jgi:hypothetical protein
VNRSHQPQTLCGRAAGAYSARAVMNSAAHRRVDQKLGDVIEGLTMLAM